MKKNTKSYSFLDEHPELCDFRRLILEKEKLLIALLEKIEQLRIDLSVTKQEYGIKIGRLYLRLDEADLEILKYKKIEDLLTRGISFDEARKIVEESLKARHEQIKEEYRKLNDDEKDVENRPLLSSDGQRELKRLWRKLAHQYHPDLTHGDDTMMKKINKAYADGDLETLRDINLNHEQKDATAETFDGLKSKLARLGESIKKARDEYSVLQKSEWYILRREIETAHGQNRDLLGELADKVLTNIASKENQLTEIKKKYGRG